MRARLLPEGATGPSSDVYIRKAKELIQAIHVTEAFPGQAGKQQIITAYLNEIFYGHGAYGIAAAAQAYFGVTDLAKLTPAQAALLAGLPKSPTTLDPYNFAKPDAKGRLVVPPDSPPAERRDWILNGLATEGGRWTHLTRGPAAGRSGRTDHPRRRQTAARTRAASSRGRSVASSTASSVTRRRQTPAATPSSRPSIGKRSNSPSAG